MEKLIEAIKASEEKIGMLEALLKAEGFDIRNPSEDRNEKVRAHITNRNHEVSYIIGIRSAAHMMGITLPKLKGMERGIFRDKDI